MYIKPGFLGATDSCSLRTPQTVTVSDLGTPEPVTSPAGFRGVLESQLE